MTPVSSTHPCYASATHTVVSQTHPTRHIGHTSPSHAHTPLRRVLQLMDSQLDAWMEAFNTYLTMDIPGLEESDPDKEGALDGVKAAVCANINLFMEKNEEDFAKYLQTFVTNVWHLLVKVRLGGGWVAAVAGSAASEVTGRPCVCWDAGMRGNLLLLLNVFDSLPSEHVGAHALLLSMSLFALSPRRHLWNAAGCCALPVLGLVGPTPQHCAASLAAPS